MSWFGWMTKGRCEVSFLDGLIACMEVLVLAVLVSSLYAWYEHRRFKKGQK